MHLLHRCRYLHPIVALPATALRTQVCRFTFVNLLCSIAQHVPFQTVKGILVQHKLNQNDNVPNINREKLKTITHDIFFAADKMGSFAGCPSFALDSSTSTLADFLIAVFNRY